MDTRIIQLIARKLSGEATAEEIAELERLLTRDPEAVYYAELITQLWDEERIREISSREITDTDIAYLKHLARHQPKFAHGPAHTGARPDAENRAPENGGVEDWGAGNRVPDNQDAENLDGGPQKRRKIRQLVVIGCLILLTGGLAGGILHAVWHSSRHVSAAIDSNAEFSAALGSRRQLILPDGTRVWLNAGSRLNYDSNMLRKDTRTVTLSGEAFFDVARDKDRSFVIHTDKIAIRVLGTAFNVKAYPRDKVTETTLMRGSVELTVNNKPYQKIVLKPKEKFALIDDTQTDPAKTGRLRQDTLINKEKLVIQDVIPVEVADKEYVKEVSWVDDNFVFQNETLEELAPKMERWFNVQIEIDNARIRGLHFTGVFHKETVDQALSALQFIQPFKFKITDNHVYIN